MMMQVPGGFLGMNYDGEYRHGSEEQIQPVLLIEWRRLGCPFGIQGLFPYASLVSKMINSGEGSSAVGE
jgi:hypothetical protein